MIFIRLFTALALFILAGCQQSDQDPGSAIATRNTPPPPKQLKLNKVLDTKRPGFVLKDLDGKQRKADDWLGKVMVVNFWATWCPPCKKEMPLFISLQDTYGPKGLQIIGIAMDDEQLVRDFSDGFATNYPILVGDVKTLQIMKDYGNHLGALPYTAVVDRQGIIRHVHTGEVTKQIAERKILSILEPNQ